MRADVVTRLCFESDDARGTRDRGKGGGGGGNASGMALLFVDVAWVVVP